ncbi:MAG: thioredoxin domain-containing protein [Marinilabiliales bacterium]|nr:MAG: thioredoxin domain-containing protein [Marinilabiliales bacterium]
MNKLKYASSPYLLQHADNPVHWQEWGEEAFALAKKENKPLIISIGYAACHWCHVMEHQSFSQQDVADFMNENFVCIKVDREERPDVDRIYMDAAQIINGQGGWPLNAFALPDGKPFFAGTYFPKDRWMEILAKISDLYKNENQKVVNYANQLTDGINTHSIDVQPNIRETTYSKQEYEELFDSFRNQIDYELGGFNRAPKFPLPIAWEFLLQYSYLTKNEDALNAVKLTLDEMAKGGIYDQVGGGFARYSVDEYWKVPHFEKMLYDNAQLISLYSHAYQITKKERYAEIIKESFDFVIRELSDKNGGFYSSLNADSEGEEGKFYVWTYDEFKSVLDDDNFELLSKYYNITIEGNWEEGNNILLIKSEKNEFAKANKISIGEFNKILSEANNQLFKYRSKRERPSTDNKILTSWNGLMLKACVDAFKALGDEKYLDAAIKNAEFLESNMMKETGFLYRNYMNNKASIPAFLDDYAALSDAFLDLYSISFNKKWLNNSKLLADYCLEHFGSEENAMFYYTSDKSEDLIARTYEITDNVIPASNSIMANVLLKLGHYFDHENYVLTAEQMFYQVKDKISESGPWYANWALLEGMLIYGTIEVAIVGDNYTEINKEMQKHYLPTCLFLGGNTENLPLLENRYIKGSTMIYVCRNKTCKLPVELVSEAMEQIK